MSLEKQDRISVLAIGVDKEVSEASGHDWSQFVLSYRKTCNDDVADLRLGYGRVWLLF